MALITNSSDFVRISKKKGKFNIIEIIGVSGRDFMTNSSDYEELIDFAKKEGFTEFQIGVLLGTLSCIHSIDKIKKEEEIIGG